jgi:hypothetical protein
MARITGCLLLILLLSSTFAQTEFKKSPVAKTDVTVKVNEKIQTKFHKFFAHAENVKWYELDNNFLVKFFMNDQQQRALFTKKAALIYHISYGSEKNLPAEVRGLVKSAYFDYNITTTIKVEENNRKAWIVNMEDAKSLISVMVENGEMEETQHIQKSK